MTWREDISDQHAEASDDALNDLYAGRDEWEPDDTAETRRELDADEFWRARDRNDEWWRE